MWPLVGIAAALIALAALLLNLSVHTRWPWPVKAVAIGVVFAAVAGAYFSVKGLLGWPVRESIPARLQVLAVDVVEPDKQQRIPGAVYVWAKAGESNQPPRAYAFAYSEALHAAAADAQGRMRAGRRQGVRLAERPRSGPAAPSPVFYDLERQLDEKTALGSRRQHKNQ